MFKAIAEKFEISQSKAKEIAEFILDTIVNEVTEKGRCFVGRNHYFKKVDRKPRRFHNLQTGQTDLTKEASFIVYKKPVAAA